MSYAFNSILCSISRVINYDLLSSVYEYSGQADIVEDIINRRRRLVTQSLCSPDLLVQYFCQDFSAFFSLYII